MFPGSAGARLKEHNRHVWFHGHARADHDLGDRAHHLRPAQAARARPVARKSLDEFKRASNELQNTLEEEMRVEEQREATQRPPPAAPADRRRVRAPSTPVESPSIDTPSATRGHAPSGRRPRRRTARPQERTWPSCPSPERPRLRRRSRRRRRRAPTRCRSWSISTSSGSGMIVAVSALGSASSSAWPSSRSCSISSSRARRDHQGRRFIHRAGRRLHAAHEAGGARRPVPGPAVILWQIWLFIAPGLYANEKKRSRSRSCSSRPSSSRSARRSRTTSRSRGRWRSSPASNGTCVHAGRI